MLSALELCLLRIKRADTPTFKTLKAGLRWFMTANLQVPRALKPSGRLLYDLRFLIPQPFKRLKSVFYVQPLFACRCESIGRRVQIFKLPAVTGHTLLYVGNDVRFNGSFDVASGRFCDHPTLRIGDRTFLGHNVSVTCNREVVIEEDVLIAGNCWISDYNGHSILPERRLTGALPCAGEIQPVRICRGAWIGAGSFILRGVTVGEGAVIGANSVVTHDIPPRSIAVGSPAKVVKMIDPEDSLAMEEPIAMNESSRVAHAL
jgi:acetyltransferase-like isoleucine patch superfamily enzyme